MPSYRVATDITAPPEVVFALVGDLAAHGDWAADDVVVEPVDDAPLAMGKRYRSKAHAKGKTFTADLELMAHEPTSRVVFTATDATGRFTHTITLAPTSNGTHVERAIDGKLSAGQALLFWLVLLPVKKPSARASLERLKARAEG